MVPARLLALLSRLFGRSIVVTIDMGDTNCRVTAFRNTRSTRPLGVESFKLIDRQSRSLDDATSWELMNVELAIKRLRARFGRVTGIAFAIAGELDKGRTRLVRAGNLTHLVGVPLKDILQRAFGCRVVLGNDAEAAALADARFGHVARDEELHETDFIGGIWGSGVGGACVRFVRSWRHDLLRVFPWLGTVPFVGSWLKRPSLVSIPSEWGHIRTGSDTGDVCGCGKTDCVERHCGGNAIPNWLEIDGVRIHSARVLGDDEWREYILPFFINGLEDYLNAQPVRLVILSGGIACNRDWVLDEIQQELKNRGFNVTVLLSYFGESAGAVGALSLFALNA